jgi:hypothetical protein
MSEWGVLLEGVYFSGGDVQVQDISSGPCSGNTAVLKGCLLAPPDGLGVPELRVEDVVFPQRDGSRFYSDWYTNRIITLQVSVGSDDCPECPSARAKVRDIVQAWDRHCGNTELVIFTDCHGTDSDRSLVGPFGAVGRPRQAIIDWVGQGSKSALMTLRFDAVDHRLYVLDECGTPGSGEQCITLNPTTASKCRTYNRCYTTTWCYTEDTGTTNPGSSTPVSGTECAYPTITLSGLLTSPEITNTTTGEIIGYSGVINAADEPIIIDTYTGTATQGAASRTHLLTGTTRWSLPPGVNSIHLNSFGENDNGMAEICWRPAVVFG